MTSIWRWAYPCAQCSFCLYFFVMLIYFAFFIWDNNVSNFAEAISYETKEWNKGAVLDVKTVD